MPDYGNIFIVDQESDSTGLVTGIYLTTQFQGTAWPELLRRALDEPRARHRWDDSPYLVRILIDELFSHIHGDETGGGISTFWEHNGHDMIIVDVWAKTVSFAIAGYQGNVNDWFGMLSFAGYVDQIEASYPRERDC